MTKQEIIDRMNAGEKLRWISREVSGFSEEEGSPNWELSVRDLWLGHERLTEKDDIMAETMAENGELIIVTDIEDFVDDLTQSIFLEIPEQ